MRTLKTRKIQDSFIVRIFPHFRNKDPQKEKRQDEQKRTINTMTEAKAAPIPEEFQLIDRYWKASNYLAVGQVRSKMSNKEETIFLTHNTVLEFRRFICSTEIHCFANLLLSHM